MQVKNKILMKIYMRTKSTGIQIPDTGAYVVIKP